MKKFFIILILFLAPTFVLADEFVPEFDKMQTLRCDFEETLFNEDNSVASTSKKFRIYKLDDENKKIYLQKEPIGYIKNFEDDKVEFTMQTMTDESIGMAEISINRLTLEYTMQSRITYDFFGTKHSKATGICKILP